LLLFKKKATSRVFSHNHWVEAQEVAMRHVLTDEEWTQLQPLLPPETPRRGRPWKSHRLVISGILWLLTAGAPWRDLPPDFGKWTTVYNRFRRWIREGVWQEILQVLYADRDARGEIDREQWNLDGSIIRAHRCAAGAPSGDPQEPENHGLGYSQGGYGSKLHIVADSRQTPLNITVTPGQQHESTQFEEVLQTTPLTQGKARRWPKAIAGDKGYSSHPNRNWLKRRRIEDVIARRSNETRDPTFNQTKYRNRNVVERTIGHLKEKRRIATRYEKKQLHFEAIVQIAIIRKLLRLGLRDSA
jgi:transposase